MNAKLARKAEALRRQQDREAAKSDYDQRQLDVQEKSARLRALRLAKVATDREETG